MAPGKSPSKAGGKKERILVALTRLNDRDTQRAAGEELIAMAVVSWALGGSWRLRCACPARTYACSTCQPVVYVHFTTVSWHLTLTEGSDCCEDVQNTSPAHSRCGATCGQIAYIRLVVAMCTGLGQ